MRKLHTLRLELEGNRKVLGKGQIFTAMKDKVDENDQTVMSQEELATLLASSNIKEDQVLAIKLNDYRRGQVEFLLTDGTTLDIPRMEEVIKEKDMKISIGNFDHIEEVIMINGLPLTKDVDKMK